MHAIICTTLILLVSWVYTYYTFSTPGMLKYFNYVMFLPAPFALLFSALEKKSFKKVIEPIIQIPKLKSILFSILYPVIFLAICGIVAVILGIGDFNNTNISKVFKLHSLSQLIFAILVLFGEEFAWRGYLLPAFQKRWGTLSAVLIVGFVWAIWHGPMMYGLATVLKTSTSPMTLCLIQMSAVMVFSFPFAYSFFYLWKYHTSNDFSLRMELAEPYYSWQYI